MAEQAIQATGAALAGRRILLADDSPYNRKAVAAYLKDAGAAVAEADHGESALAQLGGPTGFDAALLDIEMPGMDGLQAARAIRQAGQPWSGLPLVAMTAHADQKTMAAALAAGMNGFLVKPVEATTLYGTVAQVLGQPHGRPVAPCAAPGPHADDALLNLPRLQSYQRLGLLDELLADYLPQIQRRVAELGEAARQAHWHGCVDAMHALLGASGEAGALALYRQLRQLYVPMVEGRAWPTAHDWPAGVRALADRSEQALIAYAAAQRAAAPTERSMPHAAP